MTEQEYTPTRLQEDADRLNWALLRLFEATGIPAAEVAERLAVLLDDLDLDGYCGRLAGQPAPDPPTKRSASKGVAA